LYQFFSIYSDPWSEKCCHILSVPFPPHFFYENDWSIETHGSWNNLRRVFLYRLMTSKLWDLLNRESSPWFPSLNDKNYESSLIDFNWGKVWSLKKFQIKYMFGTNLIIPCVASCKLGQWNFHFLADKTKFVFVNYILMRPSLHQNIKLLSTVMQICYVSIKRAQQSVTWTFLILKALNIFFKY